MNIRDFATNAALETKGTWIPFEGAEFLIAANQNPDHKRALMRLGKTKFQGAIRKNNEAGIEAMTVEAMAEAVLLNWRGEVMDGDKPLPYSKENAVRLLGLRVFRDWVAQQANDISNFQEKEAVADAAELKSGTAVAPGVGTE